MRADYERHFAWLADARREPPTFSEETFLRIETERALSICRPDRARDFEQLYGALLEARRLCGATPLFVLLIPDEFQVEDELWRAVKDRYRPIEAGAGAAVGALDRDQPQRLLAEWLERHDIPFVDLLPRFRAQAPLADSGRHLYHLRDTHLTVRGNRVAGEALAEFLAARGY